jgi:hypothetical protein
LTTGPTNGEQKGNPGSEAVDGSVQQQSRPKKSGREGIIKMGSEVKEWSRLDSSSQRVDDEFIERLMSS